MNRNFTQVNTSCISELVLQYEGKLKEKTAHRSLLEFMFQLE